MKALVFVVCAIVATAGEAEAAEKYRCKDFVATYKAMPEAETINPRSDPNLAMSAGLVMGAYYAKTGDDFLAQDTSGLGKFERSVIDACSRSPNERVPVIVFKLAEKLNPLSKLSSQSSDDYTPVSVTDLRLDAESLGGKRVEISGVLQMMGDLAMLGEERFSMNKIFVETKNLPRNDRKFIIQNCESGCQVTIRGKAGNVMMNVGLVAEEITER